MIITERIEKSLEDNRLKPSPENLTKFANYLYDEVEDAFSVRKTQESIWIRSIIDYEALPDKERINIPIEDAPNMVVPLAAIAGESIYSIAIDLIFNTSPILTVRANDNEDAKALQVLANNLASSPNVQLKHAAEHAVLDTINMGTAFLYVPFVEGTKKTDLKKVKFFGPRIYAIPPEDIITRGGSCSDIELLPWIGFRTFPTEHELNYRAQSIEGLDISKVQPCGAVDQVRMRREQASNTHESGKRIQKIYETLDIYCCYDIDGDGEAEDLLVFYDRTSRAIMGLHYNPYERRPFLKMCYQIRAHQFNGMGIPEMLRQMQQEATVIHNHRTLNLMLANMRMWKSKPGTFATGNVHVWANRNVEVANPDDVAELKLSDVYPSASIAEANTLQLAERRVGSELPLPRPSQLMSSRTPATTTVSMLQQVNRRFAPAFDQIRQGVGGAVKHCLYRLQEQLLAGNKDVEQWIRSTFAKVTDGLAMAERAITALRDDAFDDEVAIELTASSATVNRDVDKQNMMLMVNMLVQYYQRILELASVAANPQTPPAVVDVAKQIMQKASEVLDRVMRTFDNVRDPAVLMVTFNEQNQAMDQSLTGLQPQGLQGLAQLLQAQGTNGVAPEVAPGPETLA